MAQKESFFAVQFLQNVRLKVLPAKVQRLSPEPEVDQTGNDSSSGRSGKLK